MIHLIGVSKSYPTANGEKVVLHPTTLSIPTHRNVALLGANGAGKSTLMRLIAGVEEADTGRVVRAASVSWPLGFSGGLHGSLTGLQNSEFIARIYGLPVDRVVAFVSEFSELGTYLNMPVETYSSGMRARLAFGISFSIDFDCYLIDEGLSVGDQWFRDKAQATFDQRRRHSGMLFVSHNPKTVESYCDMGIVLIDGRLVPFDSLAEAADFYSHGILPHRNSTACVDVEDVAQ
jgi:capsular polysaccharide transport system ATP-binding protein